jgi:uncharacterized protein
VATPPPRTKDPAAWLGRVAEGLVRFSWRRAPVLLAVVAVVTVGLGWFAATHLGIDARSERLLDPDLPWRQAEQKLNAAFPQRSNLLLVVVDGATPSIAQDAAGRLAAALGAQKDLFPYVYAPQLDPFLQREGLLYLDLPELREIAGRLIAAQPLIGTLAADPTLRGLFGALNLGLGGVKSGDIAWSTLDAPLAAVAASVQAGLSGHVHYVEWSALFSGRQPMAGERTQLVLVKPRLDYGTLEVGGKAEDAVRATAAKLGLDPAHGVELRLTGSVALDDEEFASVTNGIGEATAASVAVVLVLLMLAMGRLRSVLTSLFVLCIGLVWTGAFAAAAVGKLNIVSVAFVVLFVGIAVDFSIQFCVRLRAEQGPGLGEAEAARRTGAGVGGGLLLAAATSAIGFLAFTPTAYRGVSELGIIAGASMLIALALNLTVLPAALRVFDALPAGRAGQALRLPAALDEAVSAHRRPVLVAAALVLIAAAAALPSLRFDFNPLNLKDPNAPSVQTLEALTRAGLISRDTMELTAPPGEARALAAKIEKLPEVDHVTSLASFVPDNQKEKLSVVADAAQFLLPALQMPAAGPPPGAAATLAAMHKTVTALRGIAADRPTAAPRAIALADALDKAIAMGPAGLDRIRPGLLHGLATRLDSIARMLDPTPVTLDSIPPSLARDWRAANGLWRIEIQPKGRIASNAQVVAFIRAVRGVAPDAAGDAYFVYEAGQVVWRSFQQAFLYAFAGVCLVLYLVLRRLRDVVLVVGPLLFSAVLTLGTTVAIGLPINYANVIALPLLLGIGAAFNIYFVMNWRAGRAHPLQSPTARAVMFSALTTLAAVSSLAISAHRGTASMGILLALCLGYALLTALVVLPALLVRPSDAPDV